MTPLLVALGGAAGAALRYVVGRMLASARFAWATLAVNVAGCLVLGIVVTATDGGVRTALGTGFAGALTTYSAFALDTVLLHRNRRRRLAAWNVVGNLVLGISAFAVGSWLGSG